MCVFGSMVALNETIPTDIFLCRKDVFSPINRSTPIYTMIQCRCVHTIHTHTHWNRSKCATRATESIKRDYKSISTFSRHRPCLIYSVLCTLCAYFAIEHSLDLCPNNSISRRFISVTGFEIWHRSQITIAITYNIILSCE